MHTRVHCTRPFPDEGQAQTCLTVGSQSVAHICPSVHTSTLPRDHDNEKGLEPCHSFSLRKWISFQSFQFHQGWGEQGHSKSKLPGAFCRAAHFLQDIPLHFLRPKSSTKMATLPICQVTPFPSFYLWSNFLKEWVIALNYGGKSTQGYWVECWHSQYFDTEPFDGAIKYTTAP